MCLDRILERDAEGIFHTAGPEAVSRKQLGELVAAATSHPVQLIVEEPAAAPDPLRPLNLALDTERTYRRLDIDPEAWRLSAVLRTILAA